MAQRFENLAQTALDQGLSDTFRILGRQDDLIHAHIRKVNARTDFHKGLSQLLVRDLT
ncbi:MAG: hypothetical protein KQH63_19990 [Desulfobulbaceae bacterium]|nr:hypothetical protein [Desulfobulbaceae bacterium]